MMRIFFGTQNDTAGLIMRLTLGLVMLPHGLQKVFGLFGGAGLQATMNAFTAKMKEILTPEQFEKWQKQMQQRRPAAKPAGEGEKKPKKD
jgi:hypothetical protein